MPLRNVSTLIQKKLLECKILIHEDKDIICLSHSLAYSA